jgi:hypothetical protein
MLLTNTLCLLNLYYPVQIFYVGNVLVEAQIKLYIKHNQHESSNSGA